MLRKQFFISANVRRQCFVFLIFAALTEMYAAKFIYIYLYYSVKRVVETNNTNKYCFLLYFFISVHRKQTLDAQCTYPNITVASTNKQNTHFTCGREATQRIEINRAVMVKVGAISVVCVFLWKESRCITNAVIAKENMENLSEYGKLLPLCSF